MKHVVSSQPHAGSGEARGGPAALLSQSPLFLHAGPRCHPPMSSVPTGPTRGQERPTGHPRGARRDTTVGGGVVGRGGRPLYNFQPGRCATPRASEWHHTVGGWGGGMVEKGLEGGDEGGGRRRGKTGILRWGPQNRDKQTLVRHPAAARGGGELGAAAVCAFTNQRATGLHQRLPRLAQGLDQKWEGGGVGGWRGRGEKVGAPPAYVRGGTRRGQTFGLAVPPFTVRKQSLRARGWTRGRVGGQRAPRS